MGNLQIGFANVYYTLWDVSVETNYSTDGNGRHYASGETTHYFYYQNLSKDLKTAQQKALAAGCKNLNPNEELRGRTSSWKNFKKSPEQLEIEAAFAKANEAKLEEALRLQAEADAQLVANWDAFFATFAAGREFETVSNFRVREASNVTISIRFEPQNEFEESIANRHPWGFELDVPVKYSDLACKFYQGFDYYTFPGWRSMKGKTAKIVDGEFIISK